MCFSDKQGRHVIRSGPLRTFKAQDSRLKNIISRQTIIGPGAFDKLSQYIRAFPGIE